MIRVLVTGAAGRMGSEVVRAVTESDGMQVVAAVDPRIDEAQLPEGVFRSTDLAGAIEEARPNVLVDFTRPDTVAANLAIALPAGVDCVVGTTGLTEETLAKLAESSAPGTCLFYAPNFAVGAVLMMLFAEQAARLMPYAEVIELHHDRKLDAPSGTAIRTARMIAAAREERPSVPGGETELDGMEGARGAFVDGVPVHSVRLPGLVAHQQVVFGGQGQTLTITHDSIDRTSFMPGVVLAVRSVGDLSGLVVGLENLLVGE